MIFHILCCYFNMTFNFSINFDLLLLCSIAMFSSQILYFIIVTDFDNKYYYNKKTGFFIMSCNGRTSQITNSKNQIVIFHLI